ncbi:hydrolase, NUDIX family [Actinomyces graevenitzii F0530]|uniref:Hydrolase, NUDIX family n=1 Tax=Actinomyces graevenitzii F0530 TaxID=1321817 RepID=U1R3J6_9ACTO|nr:NUDIX hydrolase [Actinomyces graevenitzii]ERH14323.1 hydrolase, NUDIX family [Actinomyces graevenitzii F0530]
MSLAAKAGARSKQQAGQERKQQAGRQAKKQTKQQAKKQAGRRKERGKRPKKSLRIKASRRPPVLAAGALVWRLKNDKLQVLVVHRPRYDDWSFPKGKAEPGESMVLTAIREVAEETGRQIVLGRYLGKARRRLVSGRKKRTLYWAAQVLPEHGPGEGLRAAVKPASKREIDKVRWWKVEKAARKLTHADDKRLLARLVDWYESGQLQVRSLVLVRHAKAVSRATWGYGINSELTRPLVMGRGQAQARDVAALLSAYGVGELVSSPWKRCVDTLAPYAHGCGLDLRSDEAFTEVSALTSPEVMQASFRDLLERGSALTGLPGRGPAGPPEPEAVGPQGREPEPAPEGQLEPSYPLALCVHRPCLPLLFETLREYMGPELATKLPDSDPWLRPGQAVVVHLRRRPASVQLGTTPEGDVEAGGGGDVVVKSSQIVALELH